MDLQRDRVSATPHSRYATETAVVLLLWVGLGDSDKLYLVMQQPGSVLQSCG